MFFISKEEFRYNIHMSLSIGIVGLPNVGKSTLFNALVKGHQAKVADYPFTTIEPNVGMVEVPDERLAKLGVNLNVKKKIPATIKFIDIAGLVKNAHKGEGLGNQFLGHIREVDAIIHVLDGFSAKSNPDEAREIVNIELELAEIKKPTLYVLNVKEQDINKKRDSDTIILSAKMEEELTDLSGNVAKQYLETYGLAQSGLVRLIQESYKLLNLITFYTLIPQSQVQAWPILNGSTAPQTAGIVHTDMERGFIAADVCGYIDLIDAGGWPEAQHKGKLRIEGKEYIVQDGDVIHFKFNV
jgi:small GTP-binding protein